ncbi:hypothetical protein JCM21714_2367 [Gracilibacillus boraciitolerans JCM 21714]|uniref:Uncharacterized protein n=1 Tax=Gracilibacillus boraciitolerans JCM 21714 TaxID=1298598 RepID=W4VJF8_9BACI|nr:DUF6241 domain-containing protein [Gracilibacillus boraciitolerans]GAE93296.1 hypothetical protein JCM21714_2367 [Gracilibacillus boraciitolerans JCM 21714]
MKGKLLGMVGWIVALGLGVAVLGLAIFVGFALLSENDVEETRQAELTETESAAEQESKKTEEEASIEEEVQEVNAEKILSESAYMDTLHQMTHQKIYADQKWGAVEITEERMELMLNIAEESNFTHRDFYIETLTSWQNDNFSNAVEVHNYIWEQQNGTIGRATRMLTDEEQQQYIEKYFE